MSQTKNSQYSKEELWLLREKYKGKETPKFIADLERLHSGEPLDYIIGFKDFLGCRVSLSQKPLIPRAETEFWLENVIKEMPDSEIKCLDIFSGSGCIGLSILKNKPRSIVHFGEKNKKYIQQILMNIKYYDINKSRYRVFSSDIFNNIPETKYDYILANPPYISKNKIDNVEFSVLKWEPKGALFAKNDGIYFIKKLIEESHMYLKKRGDIYIEIDSWQKRILEKIIPKTYYNNYAFLKDQFGKWRVLHMTKK